MFNNYQPYFNYNNINKSANFKRLNFASILDGTQKTLSIINQAIPIIYQLKPLYQNAKTAFKVVNAIKEDDKININNTNESKKTVEPSQNGPTYFL